VLHRRAYRRVTSHRAARESIVPPNLFNFSDLSRSGRKKGDKGSEEAIIYGVLSLYRIEF